MSLQNRQGGIEQSWGWPSRETTDLSGLVPKSEVTGQSAVLRGTAPFITGRMRLRDKWSLADFSSAPVMVGNDDTTVFQTALAECRGAGQPLYLPKGVGGVSDTITDGTTSTLRLYGDGQGATVIETSLLTKPIASVVATSSRSQITTLSAPTVPGDSTITVGDASGVTQGDLLLLRDDLSDGVTGGDELDGGTKNLTSALAGQTVKVRSVAGPVITIYGVLNWSLASGAKVLLVSGMPSGHRVSHLTVRNVNQGTVDDLGGNSNMRAFAFNCARDVKVSHVTSEGMDGATIYLLNVYDFQVSEVHGVNQPDYEDTTIHPYLIAVAQESQYGHIHDCSLDYGRHLVTSLNSATAVAPQGVKCSDLIARHCRNSPFDIHPGTRFWSFTDCHAEACASGGFALRGPDCAIYSGTVNGSGRAVQLFYGADRTNIVGLNCFNCDTGIQNTACDDMYVRAVRIDKPRSHGIFYQDQGANWADWVQRADIDDVLITGTPAVAGLYFYSGVHKPGIRIGPGVRIPDAATKISGHSTAVAAAATLTLP